MVMGLQTDTFRIPFDISMRTYVVSALITVLAAAVSAFVVRRRLDSIDLISVLKTRE